MTTDHIADAAARWLDGPDPNGSTDQPGTVAEHHGISHRWPGYNAAATDNVAELLNAAIADGIIPLPHGTTEAYLIRTVDSRWAPTGLLIVATTNTGARRCTDTILATDLTNNETGAAAALAAVRNTAAHIHRITQDLPPAATTNAASTQPTA